MTAGRQNASLTAPHRWQNLPGAWAERLPPRYRSPCASRPITVYSTTTTINITYTTQAIHPRLPPRPRPSSVAGAGTRSRAIHVCRPAGYGSAFLSLRRSSWRCSWPRQPPVPADLAQSRQSWPKHSDPGGPMSRHCGRATEARRLGAVQRHLSQSAGRAPQQQPAAPVIVAAASEAAAAAAALDQASTRAMAIAGVYGSICTVGCGCRR